MEQHTSDDALARRIARATLATRVFVLVVIVLGAAILYLLVDLGRDTNKVVTGIEEQQDTNTATITASKRTLNLVTECTTPGRRCFERAQERTASAVADINRAAVYAAACADREGVQGVDEIYACVIRQLAHSDDR
jgi:hypothetical protein